MAEGVAFLPKNDGNARTTLTVGLWTRMAVVTTVKSEADDGLIPHFDNW